MARQRYMAIRHPLEYRQAMIGANLWRRALLNLGVVTLAAGVIVIPMYFETIVQQDTLLHQVQPFNRTHSWMVSTRAPQLENDFHGNGDRGKTSQNVSVKTSQNDQFTHIPKTLMLS